MLVYLYLPCFQFYNKITCAQHGMGTYLIDSSVIASELGVLDDRDRLTGEDRLVDADISNCTTSTSNDQGIYAIRYPVASGLISNDRDPPKMSPHRLRTPW